MGRLYNAAILRFDAHVLEKEFDVKRMGVLFLAVAALTLSGCQKPQQKLEPRAEAPPSGLDEMERTEPVPAPLEEYPSDATYESTAAGRQRPADDEVLAPTGGGSQSGRTYTVQKGDTLYKISRKFYSDASQWKRIWEANRARIPDPNRLNVGTKLIIP